MAGTLDSATIGMQNADRTIGLRVSFDEPYVHDGLALAFDRAPAWAAASPLSGTIPPGGAADVAIALSSSGLAAGGYGAVVVFATGDPFHASILSPIALHVGEIALDFVGLDPPVLNLKSSGSTVRASLQLPPAYDPHLIDVSTVSINGTLFANPSPIEFTDVNGDGIPELSLKFDRAALAAILGPGTTVPITFTGEVKDVVWFRGTALLKVTRK
jgi:hypothetical protein